MAHDAAPLRTALVGCAILVFSMGIGRFAFTPMLPMMQAEGLLSIHSGGILASVHFLGYAMGALMAGSLPLSPRNSLLTSLGAIGVATIAMGLTDNFAVWLVARWAAGVCSALVLVVVSNNFVRRLAEVGRPDLQGWVFAGVGGGTAIVGLVALLLMAAGSFSRTGWQVFGLATILATMVVFLLSRGSSFIADCHTEERDSSRTPLVWQIILPYGAMGAGYVIPATYLPIMGQQAVSSPFVFGWSWPVFGIAAAISTLITARLHAVFASRQIWLVSQIIMALGLLLPIVWPSIVSVMIGGICVGGTFMVITMAGMKEAHRVTGGTNAQHHIAAMTAAFAFGQIVGPLLAGWVYDITNSFSYPLMLASAMLVLTLLPMLKPHPTPERSLEMDERLKGS